MMVANVVVFLVCFTPVHVGLFIKFLTEMFRPGDCTALQDLQSFMEYPCPVGPHGCELEKRTRIDMMVANVVVFLVCFTPVHVGLFIKFLTEMFRPGDCTALQDLQSFMGMSSCLTANCCLDVFKEILRQWKPQLNS
ncbi:UNVERIFIED_CONTAM: hypothetical protein FKN15_058149 [Acipenser sinensis]